jgi:PAS domain S-box-containing protein
MADAPTPTSQQDQAPLLSAKPAEAQSSEAVLDALRKTIDTIPALAWSARPDGSADFFNQRYLDFVGLSAEQAQDWGWTVAVHPDDLNGLAGSWRSIMDSGKAGEREARLRRFDGEYRWFLFRTNPL